MKKLLAYMLLSIGIGTAGINSNKQTKIGDYKISGPYTYKNLSVYLAHGDNKINADNIYTLDEAMEKKLIIVHETGKVSQLKVENVSDQPIYIQSGDIVKGGKQDRVLRSDLILKPKSGKINIDSYCVESGRWAKREGESLNAFSSSKKQVVSKKLKLAAKRSGNQSYVWSEVSNFQDKMGRRMNKSVNNNRSTSSLQLTLEDKDIKKNTSDYMKNIKGQTNVKNDVVGYIFAINGEINSADFYGSNILFEKLWPKMLEASSVEAITEYDKNESHSTPTLSKVSEWLMETEKGKQSEKSLGRKGKLRVKESKENVSYETFHKDYGNTWIHRNMIKK